MIPATPPTRSRFRLSADTLAMTATLAMLTSLGPLSTDMYLPALPAIAEGWAPTIAGAQLTLSAFLLGFALGQFLYGPLSDRRGNRAPPRARFRAGGLFLVATLACIIAPNIETLTWRVSSRRSAPRLRSCWPGHRPRSLRGPRAGGNCSRMGTIMGWAGDRAGSGWVNHVAFGCARLRGDPDRGAHVTSWCYAISPRPGSRETPPTPALAEASLPIRAAFASPDLRVYCRALALTYFRPVRLYSGSSFVLQGVYGLSELARLLLRICGDRLHRRHADRAANRRQQGARRHDRARVLCLAGGGIGMPPSAIGTGSALEWSADGALR